MCKLCFADVSPSRRRVAAFEGLRFLSKKIAVPHLSEADWVAANSARFVGEALIFLHLETSLQAVGLSDIRALLEGPGGLDDWALLEDARLLGVVDCVRRKPYKYVLGRAVVDAGCEWLVRAFPETSFTVHSACAL